MNKDDFIKMEAVVEEVLPSSHYCFWKDAYE